MDLHCLPSLNSQFGQDCERFVIFFFAKTPIKIVKWDENSHAEIQLCSGQY